MRIFYAILLSALSFGLIFILDHPLGALPALGRLLDPINGCLANAEPTNIDFNQSIKLPTLQGATTVWLDEQMIPHIHASTEHDLYFVEGYLHASFRLWQIDMETRAAAGRVSEVIGDKTLAYDRKQRRKGMVYAAENSLKAMEANPETKLMMDAYTAGINYYISGLTYKDLPLEYKLMGFKPEPWTNLKIALLLKYMADDLTGATDDMAQTYLREILSPEQLKSWYPDKVEGSSSVIPAGTIFDKPSLSTPTHPADSLVFPHYLSSDFGEPKVEGKGSNNWVVSGSHTASGAPILCNDPHLGLNLPSIWYTCQLQAPGLNVFGVSLPGTPGIIIGFNDSLSWGCTNNYRDVKDFYEINPVKENPNKYWFNGGQVDFTKRVETIVVKGKPDVVDTVYYTLHGPLMYDQNYKSKDGLQRPLAMCWMGHKATNELLAISHMCKAQNYNQFVEAIMNFQCPAQNIAYADRAGNIAIWGQGQFVNKWKDQGKYVMEGFDSTTLWKELIPMHENPHVLNPAQGYLASANECVTDSTYPYWYNGGFTEIRAWRINQMLAGMNKATIKDMFAMQNDTHSLLAEKALPILLSNLNNVQDEYVEKLKNWNHNLTLETKEGTLFQIWWRMFYLDIWYRDKMRNIPDNAMPLPERTMQLLIAKNLPVPKKYQTPAGVESDLRNLITINYHRAVDSLKKLETNKSEEWYMAKNTTLSHLTKLPAFSFDHLKVGGWGNTINATKDNHGPSWRMVVQMGKEIEAYGVYPGGQSGNPGSKYYNDLLQSWVDGNYFKLNFLPNTEKQDDKNIRYTINFQKQ